jgi:5-methylcytosine-specific restriction enzyme subunit McrC
VLELSRLILNHVYIKDIVVGEGVSYSLLIGMNDLFEKLVERTVEETIEDQDELSFEAQATTDSLLKESQSISMQPDLLIKRNGEPVLVGDVKWKDEIKNDDVYQIVSYQTAYDVPSILVYPDNDGEVQNDYYVKNGKKLNILELQSGSNTTDVSEFGRNNVEEFSDALKEFGLMGD